MAELKLEMVNMKLIEKLNANARSRLSPNAISVLQEQITALIIKVDASNSWGEVTIGVPSAPFQQWLTEWAESEGLNVTALQQGLGHHAVNIVWGFKCPLFTDFDATITPDGRLVVSKRWA